MKNTLIIGAGSAGQILLNEFLKSSKLQKKYKIIGFIDDNKNLKKINSFNVIGNINSIPDVIDKYSIDTVFIAIPSATSKVMEKIFDNLQNTNVEIKIVPGISEIIEGSFDFKVIRSFDPVDLLGREEVSLDKDLINKYYKNKIVMVSGGGGSIGSVIVKYLLKLDIKNVIIFGHGENSIFEVLQKYRDERIMPYIADIKDKEKINYIISKHKPDIFIHAAAHKHVPLMEEFPDEAVSNNIIGTYNCMDACIQNRVKNFVLISTDKAVNPVNIMGSTKNIGERIALSLNKIQNNTVFSIVRFGNVLGSRGSVLNIFKMQAKNNLPLTVTHPDMTRYFMSIPEAAKLVLKATSLDEGNIYILDMGKPVKIMDLANKIAKLYSNNGYIPKIIITGIRKGEKLTEQLYYKSEKLEKTKFNKILCLKKNEKLLSESQLKEMLEQFKYAIKQFDFKKLEKLLKDYVF